MHDSQLAIAAIIIRDPVRAADLDLAWITDPRARLVIAAARAIIDSGSPVDLIAIGNRLQADGTLEAVGGWGGLQAVESAEPSVATFPYHAARVRDAGYLAALRATCADFEARCQQSAPEDAQSLVESFQQAAFQIGASTSSGGESCVGELIPAFNDALQEAFEHPDRPRGIMTGLPDLDRIVGGLRPKQLFVVGARPSVGKTALAIRILEHVAVTGKTPCMLFSLEMSKGEILERLVSGMARVDLSTIRSGRLCERDFPALTSAQSKLQNAPLFIDDRSNVTPSALLARARRAIHKHGVKLFVVDYIGLLSGDPKASLYTRMTDASQTIKRMASVLDVPVICLAQLNRDSAKADKPPSLHDLRDSGALEQDADIVGLLHRTGDGDEETTEVKLLVGKNRSGPTGPVSLEFVRRFARFESQSVYQPEA